MLNRAINLALRCLFASSRRKKNDLHYTLFTDHDGSAQVTGDELLHCFDEERSSFIMDYGDPRIVFSGGITASVMSNTELARAVAAFNVYRGTFSFPSDYEQHLKLAASRGQDPANYQVTLEIER